MTTTVPESLLSQFSQFVAERMGLHFPKERFRDLKRGIYSAAPEFGFEDTEKCVNWLLSSRLRKNQIEILASHLTVGETYFFRAKKAFDVMEKDILPQLIDLRRRSERRIRIWSAGCATGEEAYSLAILLSRAIADIKNWNLTILATDINPRFLHKAENGVYGKWSFRDVPSWIQDRYFRKKGHGRYEISSQIKRMVKFSYHNLAEDTYPSLLNDTNAMDIILCRNVLMYFTPDRTRKVIRRLYRSLVNGGWLVTSPSEVHNMLFSQFTTVNFPDAILYRKEIGKPKTPRNLFPRQVITDVKPAGLPATLQPPVEFALEPQQEPVPSQFPALLEIEGATPQEAVRDRYSEALALYEQGHYAEASKRLIELFSNDQNDSRIFPLLIRIYANQGDLSEALEWCDKGIQKDKLNPTFYYLRATILQEKNQINDALTSLKQTLYLDPHFVLAQFALGNLARQQRKSKEANKRFENALTLLSDLDQEAVLPESEGITAGRLREMIRSIAGK